MHDIKNTSKLKVGIAGYGVVGRRRRGCIDNNPDTILIAVCDRIFPNNGTFDEFHDKYINKL